MRGLYKEIESLASISKGWDDDLEFNAFAKVSLSLEIDLGNAFRVLILNTERQFGVMHTKWTYKKKLWNDTR